MTLHLYVASDSGLSSSGPQPEFLAVYASRDALTPEPGGVVNAFHIVIHILVCRPSTGMADHDRQRQIP